jgi:hypothetical protein
MEWSALLTNLLVFIVLVGIIILSSYNIATYSDILNGNTNAPDIDSGECTAMIVVNSILIAASAFAIFFFIYRLIDQSLIGIYTKEGDAMYGTEGIEDGRWIEGYTIDPTKTKYFPNPKWVQYSLWLISTFVFTASVLNVINVVKLNNGSDSNAVNPGTAYLVFSILFCIVAGVFFGYTTFRSLIPRRAAYNVSIFDVFKTSANKPVVVTKCECPPREPGTCNMTVMEFNKAKLGVEMKPPIAPGKVSTSQYK